ncbi:MAG TPA: T9SS type A sorting domain-containing protein [candidate division Zixibacteria bacterium]|nr:T9SS type A sorting domain-containing protein [candidate division Zixibacteria bacterium]
MERKTRYLKYTGLAVIVILVLLSGNLWSKNLEQAAPPMDRITQIIHDKGNIVTTVDNWGYIGGYSYPYDLPSGEWPRNSGHDYIGEMKFWMGAVTPDGDTIVADSDEDFLPLADLVSGVESFTIRLSTDTSTYDYDQEDTTGLGIGNPAYGWRVYDSTGSLVYNQVYNPLDDTFYPAGPTGMQQSFCRFSDDNGAATLGLVISQTICQWNYCYNEDLLFVILEITNTSDVDYSDFAFAIYSDIDVGGPDGTGENGRLGDLVASDLDENLAWTYDEDGYDPGWGPLVRTGIMGTKYLETPDGIGMTAFRTGQWEKIPDNDAGRYELINSTDFDTSLPPADQYYLQCTRGINLTAGKTVRVVYAIIAGQDEEEFYSNASTAQVLYDSHFIGPQPPAVPTLNARVSDKKVYLSWGDTSEVDIDPMSGVVDFRGYKLYKSTNQGYTWGFESSSSANSCLDVDYIPLAAFQVETPGKPIAHSVVDSGLTNGMEYWYCLVAYDAGDTSVPITSLQNGFGKPGSDPNVVKVIPRSDPAGYYDAFSTIEHINVGTSALSDGVLYPIIFDETEIIGDEYSVIFTESDEVTYWHMIRVDEITGDTVFVLENQTLQDADPNMYDVAEGIRPVLRNGDRIPRSIVQTGFAAENDTTLHEGYFYGPMGDVFGAPLGSDKHFRSTYEIRFTATGSNGFWFYDDVTPMNLPFEVWNTTLGYQVLAEIYDQDLDQVWEPEDRDYIVIVNTPYDGNPHPEAFPYNHTWFFRVADTDTAYAIGDVLTVEGAPVNGADDVFTFKTDGVDNSAARADIKNIRVVPDPYIGRAEWETSRFYRRLQFTNLPELCTIRIYSLAGDLVKTLQHDSNGGTEEWDMLSEDGLGIASGVYLYHVESEFGSKTGRFAVIK